MDLDRLERTLEGQLLRRTDRAYDEARKLWNGMIDRRPAAIARCAGAADVARVVLFARREGLPLAVRGGGHGVAGRASVDDGIVIDLRDMRKVDVDPAARTARVEAGATWADVDAATQAYGLATTGGIDSRTGVGGLTLGGGQGWLARKHGLTIDNVLRVELVTAEGEHLRASADENPDAYWALRGGSGNFGVAVAFDYRLHAVGPEVLTGQAYYPLSDAPLVLRAYRELIARAPEDLSVYALLMRVPPVAPFPEERFGEVIVALVGCWFGAPHEGASLLDPLADIGHPILSAVAPMPYVAWQQAFDAGTPDGARYYYKAHYLPELADGVLDALVRVAGTLTGPLSMVGLECLGGAVARVERDATAFPHRDAAFSLGIWGGWLDAGEDDAVIAWVRSASEATQPYASGAYVNYMSGDDDRAGDAFGGNLGRLREVKARLDPKGVFRGNQVLAPAP